MEFLSYLDTTIAQKMLKFPLLGENIPEKWNTVLRRELDRGNDNSLFRLEPSKDSLPLFVGKMFNQFCLTSDYSSLQIRGGYFDNLSLGICIFEVKGSFSGSVLALRDINASVGFDFGSSQLPVARFDIEDTTVQQSKITVLYRVQSSQDLIIRLNGMLIDQLYPSSASDGNLGGAVKTFGSVVNAVISNVVMKNSQGPCF